MLLINDDLVIVQSCFGGGAAWLALVRSVCLLGSYVLLVIIILSTHYLVYQFARIKNFRSAVIVLVS